MGVYLAVYDKVKALLDAAKSGGSLTYIKQIYEGRQDNASHQANLPYLIITARPQAEEYVSFPKRKNANFIMDVWCVVGNKTVSASHSGFRGLIKVMEDVMNVLDTADHNLDGTVVFANIHPGEFDYEGEGVYAGSVVINPTDRFQGGAR